MNKKITYGLVLFVFSGISHAETGLEKLFGVAPGNTAPFPLENTGHPFSVAQIPTEHPSLAKIYPDLQLFVLMPESKVAGISGRKAMRNYKECSEMRMELLGVLKSVFPNTYQGEDSQWEFQTNNGEVVAEVRCVRSGNNPYPQLAMQIAHLQTHSKYQARLRAY